MKVILRENQTCNIDFSKGNQRLKHCGVGISVLCPPEKLSALKGTLGENILNEMDIKKLLIKAKVPVIFSIFTIFSNGCGYYCDVETCTYEVASQESWLPESVNQAIQFWATKGVFLEQVEEGGEIKVEVKDVNDGKGDVHGGYYEPYGAIISLSEKYYNLNFLDFEEDALNLRRKCSMAHEMGHSFGMGHLENDNGLLSAEVVYSENECPWSEEDQEELDRIIRQDNVQGEQEQENQ